MNGRGRRSTATTKEDVHRPPKLPRIGSVSVNPLGPERGALPLTQLPVGTALVVPGGLGFFRNIERQEIPMGSP